MFGTSKIFKSKSNIDNTELQSVFHTTNFQKEEPFLINSINISTGCV
jgi:hypothetical protein